MRCCLILLFSISSMPLMAGPLMAGEPLLRPRDRIALLGGTFVEQMQSTGAFEAELHGRHPDWKLTVRNLGWSGDDVHGIARKRFDDAEQGYARMLADVETAQPAVVLVAYGASEASDGPEAVERFEIGLKRLVNDLKERSIRVILVPPIAMPGYKIAGYQEAIENCRQIVVRVGEQSQTPAITIDWSPDARDVTENGLLPNDLGYSKYAMLLADQLAGGATSSQSDSELRSLIVEKNELFFHRFRPQNETYLLLFRKHEQGNNAVEIEQFDPLIRQADEAIWARAKQSSSGLNVKRR